jgi:hypothetical protein
MVRPVLLARGRRPWQQNSRAVVTRSWHAVGDQSRQAGKAPRAPALGQSCTEARRLRQRSEAPKEPPPWLPPAPGAWATRCQLSAPTRKRAGTSAFCTTLGRFLWSRS